MMYQPRPRRPIPPHPNYPRPSMGPAPKKPNSNIKGLISKFSTEDGSLDIDKITTTAQQVKQIYDQVGPYVTKFIKKK
ncbi:YppG family protein [Aquibacillus salsiterrae]|uniref:YppG family protein n=1 Tax=Aquibacillus salsiterrae TaxID=2950439 RepID=A0A9X3WFZ9_9BACI|nr:YppG family protein [Aquibacillus salsiterrae]MDC3417963.1 YppG family protein [Aquibacillus salsiterrae]